MGLLALVILEDQTGSPDGVVSTMFLFSPMVRNPVELWRGLSLLATHTMGPLLMLLYHMPKYQEELVLEKKPRAKTWLGDTRVWLVRRVCVGVKVSEENEIVMCDAKNQKRKNTKPGMLCLQRES
ncbi:hypothetical protein V8G54_033327 [Vigna mungo]|uniref:Uncharacterized protein n=1 Tax=Vigna mungo TaxID=3915 RepID=A0AAQ3MMR8_VIGMU